jgi:hypothetical protein
VHCKGGCDAWSTVASLCHHCIECCTCRSAMILMVHKSIRYGIADRKHSSYTTLVSNGCIVVKAEWFPNWLGLVMTL